MSVQRYRLPNVEPLPSRVGNWVDYADHVSEINKLERIHQHEINELRHEIGVARDDSFVAGLHAAREAVAVLYSKWVDIDTVHDAITAIEQLIKENTNA